MHIENWIENVKQKSKTNRVLLLNETKHENAKGEYYDLNRENQKFHDWVKAIVNQDLITLDQALTWSSKKEHKADALAPEAEEGRDKLR